MGGNKRDLGGKVSKVDVNRFLQQRGYKNMVYLETSALTNTNITDAFNQVAKLCLRNCVNDNVYVLQETNQQIMDEIEENDGSINLEEVMSNPDHEVESGLLITSSRLIDPSFSSISSIIC